MVYDIQSFTKVYKVTVIYVYVHPLNFQVIEGVLQHLDEVLTMLSDVSGFSIVRIPCDSVRMYVHMYPDW